MANSLSCGHRSPRSDRSASCSPYCSLGTRWKESRTGCPAFLSKFIVIVSAIVDDTYEYDGNIYVESPHGYSAVYGSFSDVTPLEERPVYAIIDMPIAAKDLPTLVSVEYNGIVYQYTCN